IVPPKELVAVLDNIGVPYSGLNLSYSNSAPIGPGDADILVSLTPDHHPTDDYMRRGPPAPPARLPGTTLAYLPPRIVSPSPQLGLPAPLDIQIVGNRLDANREYAEQMMAEVRRIPGITDLRIHQPFNQPMLKVAVDRTLAQQVGYSQRDVAGNLLVA